MNPFIQFLIVFDLICFGVYFGGDIICTALAKVRKKPGQKDPYEFEVEDEPAEPPLSDVYKRQDEKTAQPVNQKKMKKLSRADRKQIEAAIALSLIHI